MENFTEEEIRIDKIQRYLMGELSLEEAAEVEATMKQDAAYAKEVEKYSFLLDGFRTMDAQNLRSNIQSWEEETPVSTTRPLIPRWTLAIAAAVAFIIGLGFVFQWYSAPTLNLQEVYAQSMTDFEPDMRVRGEPTNSADSIQQVLINALNIYQAGRYAEAIPLLQNWLESYQGQNAQSLANAQLCLGVAQLRLNQHQEAIKSFQSIAEHSAYHQHAQWYSALLYLKTGDTEAARTFLEELKTDPYYRERVQSVLAAIST